MRERRALARCGRSSRGRGAGGRRSENDLRGATRRRRKRRRALGASLGGLAARLDRWDARQLVCMPIPQYREAVWSSRASVGAMWRAPAEARLAGGCLSAPAAGRARLARAVACEGRPNAGLVSDYKAGMGISRTRLWYRSKQAGQHGMHGHAYHAGRAGRACSLGCEREESLRTTCATQRCLAGRSCQTISELGASCGSQSNNVRVPLSNPALYGRRLKECSKTSWTPATGGQSVTGSASSTSNSFGDFRSSGDQKRCVGSTHVH
eukprot:351591-Chlamydomonas_euryale.AAC.2